ncbi:MAG: FHA domain-containing protein [Methylococcaceae bacterium]|nr:FHA domain-containing protein [Methylococcaceae bacterium]
MAKNNQKNHGNVSGSLWTQQLFNGNVDNSNNKNNKLEIIRNGIIVNEIRLNEFKKQINIGRHPNADIQLESAQMAMFHLAIVKQKLNYFIEDLNSEAGTYLNNQYIAPEKTVQLCDGYIIELPEFHLRCILPDSPPLNDEKGTLEEIHNTIIKPIQFPKPKAALLLTNLIEHQEELQFWTGGLTSLIVSDIINETHDTKSFRFIGEKPLLFSYKPGQFITLMLEIDGKKVCRSYSISSSPSRPHILKITIKRVANGLVSNWLCDNLKLGDKIKVKGPSGKFTCFDYPSGKILFICAGSGITPMISMMRWIIDTAATVDIKMLVSSKTPSDIIFRKELELMSARHNHFQIAATITTSSMGTESWLGYTGRVNENMLKLLSPDFKERHIFLCGPAPFMQSIEQILRNMEFPMGNLHIESFAEGRVAKGIDIKDLPKDGKYRVKFSKSNLTARTNGEHSLLEIAEAHGIEIEYSCRVGSCGLCMVKCKGDVNVDNDCEIDKKDEQAGYVFSCCSKAKANVEIDA